MRTFKLIIIMFLGAASGLYLLSEGAMYFFDYSISEELASWGFSVWQVLALFLGWGFLGGMINLVSCKFTLQRHLDSTTINRSSEPTHTKIIKMVNKIRIKAKIPMPEVGIYPSNEINAMASGFSKRNAIIVLSSQLVNSLKNSELEAVIAHEIAHIKNGDMVSQTVLDGFMGAYFSFLSNLFGFIFASDSENKSFSLGLFALIGSVCEFILLNINKFIYLWLSRSREYRADALAAELTSINQITSALISINNNGVIPENRWSSLQFFSSAGEFDLFCTHPNINKRIRAINSLSKN